MLEFLKKKKKVDKKTQLSHHRLYILTNKVCLEEYKKTIHENDAYYGC